MRASFRRLTTGRTGLAWRLLTGAAIVAVGLTQIDLAGVADALADLSLPVAVAAWALLLGGQVVSGLRWGVIAGWLGSRAPGGWYVRAYLRGAFYNVFLPTGIGGDAMRIAVLRHELGLRRSARSVVIDRASGLLAITLVAGVSLPFTGYQEELAWFDLPWLDVALCGVAAVAATVLGLEVTRRGLGGLVVSTLLFMLLWFAGIWLLAEALHMDVDAGAMPIVTLCVAIAIALPVSIGGTGTREAGFAFALAPLGIGTEAAVALGILFGITVALVGLVGAPLSVAPPREEPAGT